MSVKTAFYTCSLIDISYLFWFQPNKNLTEQQIQFFNSALSVWCRTIWYLATDFLDTTNRLPQIRHHRFLGGECKWRNIAVWRAWSSFYVSTRPTTTCYNSNEDTSRFAIHPRFVKEHTRVSILTSTDFLVNLIFLRKNSEYLYTNFTWRRRKMM